MFETKDSKKGVKQFISKIQTNFPSVTDIFLNYNKLTIAIRSNETVKLFQSKDNHVKLTYNYFYNLLSNLEKNELLEKNSLDKAYKIDDLILRLHFYKEVSGKALSIRIKKSKIPNLLNLGFDKNDIKKMLKIKNGLIIIAGPHGNGKSTTVASFLNEYAKEYSGHIITLEDPIEYIFNDNKAFFSQREIGTNVESFNIALKDSLRESPDVIFVSEIRTPEIAEEVLRAALTGKLVITTLHSLNIIGSIERLYNLLKNENLKKDLTNILKLIINQRLIPLKDNSTKLVYELLDINEDIKEFLESNENITKKINNYIQETELPTINNKLIELHSYTKIDTKTLEKYSN